MYIYIYSNIYIYAYTNILRHISIYNESLLNDQLQYTPLPNGLLHPNANNGLLEVWNTRNNNASRLSNISENTVLE